MFYCWYLILLRCDLWPCDFGRLLCIGCDVINILRVGTDFTLDRWISVTARLLQNHNAPTYKISAKSRNPRLSYSDLKIWNLWRNSTLDFTVLCISVTARDLRGYITLPYWIWAKSSNPRRINSNLNVENSGAVRHLGLNESWFSKFCSLREPVMSNFNEIWQCTVELLII